MNYYYICWVYKVYYYYIVIKKNTISAIIIIVVGSIIVLKYWKKQITTISNKISIEYNFFDKKIIVKPHEEINLATFEIYDSKNNLILNWSTHVINPLTYWHTIDLNGSYRFEIHCNGKLTHLQKIHINTKMMDYDWNSYFFSS